jgi:cell wall-associated NlpC family hydrolase
VAKWIVNLCLNGWIVLLRGFLRGVLLFMFYKKFAAVVLSAVLVGVVPSVVFADVDGVSAVSDGDVEVLSIEDGFSDGADSISAFASALADKTVSEVQGYQEAKAEAEAAAEAARKAEEERKAAEEARLEMRQGIVDFALQFVGNPYVYGGTSLTNGADCSGFVMSVFAEFGYELPRVAAAQCAASEKKSVADIEAGDLVFYGDGGIDHVALYIGDGKIVHASTAATGIKVSDYDYRAPAAVGSFVA